MNEPPSPTPQSSSSPAVMDERLQARMARQEATGRLGLAALAGIGTQELMEQAVKTVAGVLFVEYCEILELVPEGDRLLLRAGEGWREGYVGQATVGVGLDSQAGYTLISEQPVVVEDLESEIRFSGPPLLLEHEVLSGLTTKIYVAGHPWGVLGAHTRSRRSFSEDEIQFLEEIAAVVGAAIERQRTEERAQRELTEHKEVASAAQRRFTFLAEANSHLSSTTDYTTVVATAARLVVPALAQWCFVDVVEEGEGVVHRLALAYSDEIEEELAAKLEYEYPLSSGVSHGTLEVMRTGRAELLSEINDELLKDIARSRDHLNLLRHLKPVSYICVPLRVAGRTLGAIGMVSANPDHRYGKEDIALAEGLAHSAALALDNARRHVPEAELAREIVERARTQRATIIAPARREEIPELTSRQLEVLKLLAEGKSAREIGAELYLSQATVRNHIRSLLQALGAHSQLEALALARKVGLISE